MVSAFGQGFDAFTHIRVQLAQVDHAVFDEVGFAVLQPFLHPATGWSETETVIFAKKNSPRAPREIAGPTMVKRLRRRKQRCAPRGKMNLAPTSNNQHTTKPKVVTAIGWRGDAAAER